MKLLSNARKSARLKKILFYLVIAFCFLYTFCVPSFGESKTILRYFIYLSMSLLGVTSILYCFIFDDLRINKLSIIIPVFALFAFFGTLTYSKDFRGWLSLILLCGSFFVFLYCFKAIKNKYLILSIIALAFFAFSLYFIVYYRKELLSFNSFQKESFRLGTHFDNQNGVGAYAIVGFATSFYLVLFLKNKFRFAFIIPSLTSLLVGISTGSRTFIFAFAVFVIVFLYFIFRKHKLIYFIVVIALIVLGILLLNLPLLATMKERILRSLGTVFGFGNSVDTSTIERAIWTDYGFVLGGKNAIFGRGVSGFSIASGVGTYAHSNYAETLCDFGIIGFLLFYAPLIIFVVNAFFNKKIDRSLIIPFVTYYIIVSISNVIYYKKIYYLILAFLFFLSFVDGREYKKVQLIPSLKKILFVCDTMGSGGAEKVIATLANEFSNYAINVQIIGVGDNKKPVSFYHLEKDVSYTNFYDDTKKRVSSIKRVFLLRKTIKQINPDVVVSFLPNANIYAFLSLVGTKVPHVVSERNNPYLNPKEPLIRVLKKMAFRFSNGCVFQTNAAKNFYSKKIQEKSTIIKNPITVPTIPFKKPINRKKVVLAVGRLTEQKNYKCLIDAFKIFNSQVNHSYVLKIYGDGPLKDDLIGYCLANGLSNNVLFAGNDNEWQTKEYDDSMYVLSSNYEGMPNALAEAMALGIPSISTDCPTGGSRELIRDGYNGYLVPVNNSDILARRMLDLVSSPSLDLYVNTRDMIKDYSPASIATAWINFFKSFIKEKYE